MKNAKTIEKPIYFWLIVLFFSEFSEKHVSLQTVRLNSWPWRPGNQRLASLAFDFSPKAVEMFQKQRNEMVDVWSNYSDLTRPISPKRLQIGREITLIGGNLGWWNIIIWPDINI